MISRGWVVLSGLVGIFTGMLLTVSPVRTQEKPPKTLAVLPVQGSHLSSEQQSLITGAIADAVQKRGDYVLLDAASVDEYMQARTTPIRMDVASLREIGEALQVEYVLIPELTEEDSQTIFKLYLFDVRRQKIVKISRQTCECQPNQPETFPVQAALKIVFDVPEIILTAGMEPEAPELPPPPVAPKPDAEPEENTGPAEEAASDTLSVSQQSLPPVLPPKSKFKWKPYAAGAVLVGGGILYILSRGNPKNGGQGGRLPDPPGTPDSK